MAIDFPSSPVTGQVFNAAPGRSFVWRSVAWEPVSVTTALSKNLIVNGNMEVSQQNATTAGTVAGFYPADQWYTPVSGIVFDTAQQVSADGWRIYIRTTTGKAMAVTDYMQIQQNIEGVRFMDAMFGTPTAKQLVTRFTFYGIAGTFGFTFRNFSGTRSFLANFTAPGPGWNTYTIVIPGDTAGPASNWPQVEDGCASWSIVPACGTNYNGPAGWQDGNKLAVTGNTNGAATSANIFYLKEVGLYLDPYQTGVAPPWEPPAFVDELISSQRYWHKSFATRGDTANTVTNNQIAAPHPVMMRLKPTVTVVGSPIGYDAAVSPVISAVAGNQSNTSVVELNCTIGTVTAARPGGHIWNSEANYFACSARMPP
jgi:hypothetical protein